MSRSAPGTAFRVQIADQARPKTNAGHARNASQRFAASAITRASVATASTAQNALGAAKTVTKLYAMDASPGAPSATCSPAMDASMTMKGAMIVMKKNPKKQPTTRPKLEGSVPTSTPVLKFSPTAWAKLLFLRDYGDTEVGGFEISPRNDLLYIEDVQLVKQVCSWAHVAFDDESVADFFDAQVDAGRRPEQFGRIWVHTHPGECPRPSLTDEETFDRVFGRADWAVMFIVAQAGQTYARLRFNVGPGGEVEIPVEVDFGHAFPGCDADGWEQEYLGNVQHQAVISTKAKPAQGELASPFDDKPADDWYESWFQYADEDEVLV